MKYPFIMYFYFYFILVFVKKKISQRSLVTSPPCPLRAATTSGLSSVPT